MQVTETPDFCRKLTTSGKSVPRTDLPEIPESKPNKVISLLVTKDLLAAGREYAIYNQLPENHLRSQGICSFPGGAGSGLSGWNSNLKCVQRMGEDQAVAEPR